jgi:uncharacterized protein
MLLDRPFHPGNTMVSRSVRLSYSVTYRPLRLRTRGRVTQGATWRSLFFAVLLAMLLGFAAHRASICMVRTIAEIMSARTGYMLVSVGESVFWVWAVTIPIFWLMPALGMHISGWSLTGYAMLGGLLFGLGAALNGGCAFSTMARLVDGDGKMLATVCGFAVGVFGFVVLVGRQWLSPPAPAPALIGELHGWAMVSAFAFLAWAVYESVRLWLTRETGARFTDLILAPRYRLSIAALLIGFSGALLECTWVSMKPGATSLSRASISRSTAPSKRSPTNSTLLRS